MSVTALTSVLPLRQFFAITLGVMVMTIASHLSIDVGPVPFTFQDGGVHFLAMLLPPGCAFLSILSWITWGIFGWPIFALYCSGAESVCDPAGGYFWGMLMGAPLMSMCQLRWSKFFNQLFSQKPTYEDDHLSFSASILVGFLGSLFIIFWGWFFLGWCYGYEYALHAGVLPFILPGLFKIILISSLISIFKLSKLGY
jgi:biotin transporter BioY